MKYNWITMPSVISRFALVLVTMQIACVCVVAQEAKDQVAGKLGVDAIPALAYFDQKDIDQDGRYVLVLSLIHISEPTRPY